MNKDNLSKIPGNMRRHIRFLPDLGTVALVDLKNFGNSKFYPTLAALVVNESHSGACLLLSGAPGDHLKDSARWLVQFGQLNPMEAEVCWVKELDVDVQKVGIE